MTPLPFVIGQWVRGHLEPQPAAADRLEPRGILVAVGSSEGLAELRILAGSGRPTAPERPFIVAGYGEVGQKVAQLLRDAGEEVRVIDLVAAEGVDAVGDILDATTPDLDSLTAFVRTTLDTLDTHRELFLYVTHGTAAAADQPVSEATTT